MIPIILVGVGAYMIADSIKSRKYAHGGMTSYADGWKKAVTIKRPTKSEAIKNAKLLAEYYGKSGRNYKVEQRGDGYVVTYEFNLSENKMVNGGMVKKPLTFGELKVGQEYYQVTRPDLGIEKIKITEKDNSSYKYMSDKFSSEQYVTKYQGKYSDNEELYGIYQNKDDAKQKAVELLMEKMSKYAKGGVVYLGDYKNDGKNYYFRRFKDAIGSFAWMYNKNYNEGILYPLSDFDREYYSHIKLKNGEHLFRYKTDRMIKDAAYLIKINLDKSLLYFMTDTDSEDDKNPTFDTRGIKAEYIAVQEDKLAYGGYMEKGGNIESDLELFDINNLDDFELMQYNRFVENGIPKEKALQVLINNVEGDYSELSPKLAKIAKKYKMAYGGYMEKGGEFTPTKEIYSGKFIKIKMPKIGDFKEEKIVARYDKEDFIFKIYDEDKKRVLRRIGALDFENNLMNGSYIIEGYMGYAKGGVTFDDKVKAVKSSLLKRKKVSPSVQKDYGKTYSPKEAEESAKRIVGSMRKKYGYGNGGEINEIEVKLDDNVEIEITKEDNGVNTYYSVSYQKDDMEITGELLPYKTGRTTEYEFSPSYFSDKEIEDYYADNWEDVEEQILKVFNKTNFK